MVAVRIPSPLRSYTAGAATVSAAGTDLAEVLADLDRQFPGLRFRVVDEQGRIRQHLRVFVNDEPTRSLDTPVCAGDEVTVLSALSGG